MTARRVQVKVASLGMLCAATLMVAVAGCGGVRTDQPAGGDPSAAPSSPAPSVGAERTALTIVVDDGKGGVTTTRLTCDPVGGDHPDAEAACGVLARNGTKALAAVPRDRVCTQNFGGPQSATVTGVWQGRQVHSRFNLRNGCEIDRWELLTGLLPPTGS